MTESAHSPGDPHAGPASIWPDSVDEPTDLSRLARGIGWIAGAIALVVAVAMPAGYFWLSAQAEQRESAIAARLHAAFVSQAVADAGDGWQDDVIDMIGVDLAPSRLPEQRLLLDRNQAVIDVHGNAPPWPVIAQSAPLRLRRDVEGSVEVRRSLVPLLVESGWIGMLSTLLGLAIFASLRLLPLSALRRVLAELRSQEAQARAESQAQLRIVFEHAVEGIVLFSPSGRVLSGNPAAARMFGYASTQIAGLSIARLV